MIASGLDRCCAFPALNRMLKKSFPGLFQPGKRKTRFLTSFIVNGLLLSKMVVHPCAAHRLSKNGIFQQPVKRQYFFSNVLTNDSIWPSFY